MEDDRATVVVVGGGFSGTMAAAHLLRKRLATPLRVVLVNRSGRAARGIAYGTRSEALVLNVPAAGMSAYPGDSEHFLRYLRWRDEATGPGTFAPRALYGEYLEWTLEDAERLAGPGNVLERVDAHAVDLEPVRDGVIVALADGVRIAADAVVLALGNYTPADPAVGEREVLSDRRYVRDPWRQGALDAVDRELPVLLIGTGLTMMDVALELRRRGHAGRMVAISRRGLLPRAHAPAAAPAPGELPQPDLLSGPHTARAFCHGFRRYVATLAGWGVDWRDALGALRPFTAALWRSLGLRERERFLRHLRPYWEVHRHRAAPAIHEAVQGLLAEGALEVRAGRILWMSALEEGIHAMVRAHPHDGGGVLSLQVGTVINCTGPTTSLQALREPLLDALQRRGLVSPDALGLGLETSDRLALLGADGWPQERLFYVGPFLRAQYWECTAVPELRVHAARVADEVQRLVEPAPPPRPGRAPGRSPVPATARRARAASWAPPVRLDPRIPEAE